MQAFDLLTIGHSNIAAEHFIGLLRGAGADTIADVRSTPFSRRFPWFSGKNLAVRLKQEGMAYAAFGDTLGGRPRDAALYCDGIADYEAMARQEDFRAGLDRLLALAAERRVCLMCAEREPLDCHRYLLVARALGARGRSIGHILHDGTIEPHARTEVRLLALDAAADLSTPDLFGAGLFTRDLLTPGQFTPGQSERLAAAYRHRTRAVAYRVKPIKTTRANKAAEKR